MTKDVMIVTVLVTPVETFRLFRNFFIRFTPPNRTGTKINVKTTEVILTTFADTKTLKSIPPNTMITAAICNFGKLFVLTNLPSSSAACRAFLRQVK